MDTTTALALVLRGQFCDKINEIRSVHDRAYPRWPPHINFLFPFIEKELFPEAIEKLNTVLKDFGEFELIFNQLSYFPQGKNATFHLKVANDTKLQELFKKIQEALPEIKSKHDKFEPHLTLGQCKKADVNAELDRLRANWLGFGFTVKVKDICLLSRSKDDKNIPFSEQALILL